MDEDFIKVRDYIYDHEKAEVEQIAEDTGVSTQMILHLLKEGRLVIGGAEGSGGGALVCELCNKPINSGRLCQECMAKFSSKIQSKAPPQAPASAPAPAARKDAAKPQGVKMHSADKRRPR
jgi:hypothetical protein